MFRRIWIVVLLFSLRVYAPTSSDKPKPFAARLQNSKTLKKTKLFARAWNDNVDAPGSSDDVLVLKEMMQKIDEMSLWAHHESSAAVGNSVYRELKSKAFLEPFKQSLEDLRVAVFIYSLEHNFAKPDGLAALLRDVLLNLMLKKDFWATVIQTRLGVGFYKNIHNAKPGDKTLMPHSEFNFIEPVVVNAAEKSFQRKLALGSSLHTLFEQGNNKIIKKYCKSKKVQENSQFINTSFDGLIDRLVSLILAKASSSQASAKKEVLACNASAIASWAQPYKLEGVDGFLLKDIKGWINKDFSKKFIGMDGASFEAFVPDNYEGLNEFLKQICLECVDESGKDEVVAAKPLEPVLAVEVLDKKEQPDPVALNQPIQEEKPVEPKQLKTVVAYGQQKSVMTAKAKKDPLRQEHKDKMFRLVSMFADPFMFKSDKAFSVQEKRLLNILCNLSVIRNFWLGVLSKEKDKLIFKRKAKLINLAESELRMISLAKRQIFFHYGFNKADQAPSDKDKDIDKIEDFVAERREAVNILFDGDKSAVGVLSQEFYPDLSKDGAQIISPEQSPKKGELSEDPLVKVSFSNLLHVRLLKDLDKEDIEAFREEVQAFLEELVNKWFQQNIFNYENKSVEDDLLLQRYLKNNFLKSINFKFCRTDNQILLGSNGGIVVQMPIPGSMLKAFIRERYNVDYSEDESVDDKASPDIKIFLKKNVSGYKQKFLAALLAPIFYDFTSHDKTLDKISDVKIVKDGQERVVSLTEAIAESIFSKDDQPSFEHLIPNVLHLSSDWLEKIGQPSKQIIHSFGVTR